MLLKLQHPIVSFFVTGFVMLALVSLDMMPADAAIKAKRAERAFQVTNVTVSRGVASVAVKNVYSKRRTSLLHNPRTGKSSRKALSPGGSSTLRVPIQRGTTTLSLQTLQPGVSAIVAYITVQFGKQQLVVVDNPTVRDATGTAWITNPMPKRASTIYVKIRRDGGWSSATRLGRFKARQASIAVSLPSLKRGKIAEFRLWVDDGVAKAVVLQQKYQISRN